MTCIFKNRSYDDSVHDNQDVLPIKSYHIHVYADIPYKDSGHKKNDLYGTDTI
jgi:hypothetical protein